MNPNWLSTSINLVLLGLTVISVPLLLIGSIRAVKSKSLKPLKWGVILVVITMLLFFAYVISGQIFSGGGPSRGNLPTLE